MPRSKGPTLTGDAAQVRCLLDWARANRVELSVVSVGSCRVEVREAVVARSGDEAVTKSSREAIYEQFGGEAYRRMTGVKPGPAAVPGEDYQPALEVG